MSAPPSQPAPPAAVSHTLRSGHRVDVTDGPAEAVRITSPDGVVELELVFGPGGAILRGRALRLELDAEHLALRGRVVSVQAEELRVEARAVSVVTEDDLTLTGGHDVVVAAGAHIRLN